MARCILVQQAQAIRTGPMRTAVSVGIGYQVPTGRWGIAQALGLPDAGCEFGACGGGLDFADNGSTDPANHIQYFTASVLELFGYGIAYANWGDPNERLFGTHYCGPGGGGRDINRLDTLCHIHDDCYTGFGGRFGESAWASQHTVVTGANCRYQRLQSSVSHRR